MINRHQEEMMGQPLLKTCRMLWVDTDGYQRDHKVSLSDFNDLQITISLTFADGRTLSVHLQSIDGFRFSGKSTGNGQPLIVMVTLYRHDNEYLFFGTWQQGTSTGRLVIHAQAVYPVVNRTIRIAELDTAA